MKILVTGASGYIGSNLVDYLSNKGYMVYGCCRTQVKQREERYVISDLVKEVPDFEVDIVIHTAALGPSANTDFNKYFDNNVIATRNILQYAKEYHVRKVIYMGAVSSYGNVDYVLREDSPHNNPGDYGLTKYIAEQLIRNSGIPNDILILPGVVGKGCRNNWLINTARTIYKCENFTYYNADGLFNNVLEINDLCKFILKRLKINLDKSETYLLGTEEYMKVEQVIAFLKKELSSNSLCRNEGDGNSFYLDISKAVNVGFCSKSMVEILYEVCREVLNEGEKLK